ncbi:MAG: DUF3780 domain-containing protein [Desulfoprunum sp.]|uniref:DUF3780 domain-containing protein n=1 Tax=Desulfoprunum sp. TaxID=2020866 RepID=UPI003C74EC0E
MSTPAVHDFGVVDPMGDFYELTCEAGKSGQCLLSEIIQTERGPRRTELAVIPVALWDVVSDRVVRELAEGMGEAERPKKAPVLKRGANRLSPLIGRELAVLLWALTEAGGDAHAEAILHGWRELAREERWWLYAKGAAPGQRQGAGWRLALFHALSESPDSRATDTATPEKKSPGNGLPKTQERATGKKAEKKQPLPKPASTMKASPVALTKNQAAPKTAQKKTPAPAEKAPVKKAKKTTRKAAQDS